MYSLIAQFSRQQVCRDRQVTALLKWSAYQLALPIPGEKPAEDVVKQRIVAGRVQINPDMVVAGTINGVASTPDIQTNIRQHLSAFNDEQTEVAMDSQVDFALATVMPTYCRGVVSDTEAEMWYLDNGFPPEPAQAAQPQQPQMPRTQ